MPVLLYKLGILFTGFDLACDSRVYDLIRGQGKELQRALNRLFYCGEKRTCPWLLLYGGFCSIFGELAASPNAEMGLVSIPSWMR